MKILVVEDDESTRMQLRKWLESDGYEVVEATCGSEALAIITGQDPPQLIVLDWMMPAPDGIEVCRRLRQHERNKDRYAYVLMLTARIQPEDMYEGFEVGVDDFMTKPFDGKEMLFRLRSGKRIVKEIVTRRKAQTALKEVKEAEKHAIIGLLESIATALSRVENIDELGAMVESTVERMLDVSFTGIYLFDTQSGRLRLLFAKGFTEEERAEAERTAMDRHPGEVFRTLKMLHVPDTDIEPNKSTSSDRSFVIRSRLYLPIMSRETCVGCFGLGSSVPHAFSDEHIQLLRFVGNMVAVVYQNIQAREAIAVQKQRLAGILRGTNSGTWEWNVQTGETVFNERWAEIIGYSLEELSPVSIETWTSRCHPDDLKASGQLLERHFQGELDYYEFEARMKHKSGAWIWVLDRGRVISWTDNGKPSLMMGTHLDITERKRAESSLVAYDSLLRAVSVATERFVGSTDWATTLQEVMSEVGPAAHASRAYLFRVDKNEHGTVLASQTHEWCAAGIEPQIDNPDLQEVPLRDAGLSHWEKALSSGRQFGGLVRDLSQADREILEPQGIVSIVVTPVLTPEGWWGFLGFDECSGERIWSQAERETLRIVADALGSAIARQKAETQLRQAWDREIRIGGHIQSTLLNGTPPQNLHGVNFASITIPSQQVDGDFWEVFPHSDAILDFVVGDVMGKGVAAAIIGAATMKQLLRKYGDRLGRNHLLQIKSVAGFLNQVMSEQLMSVESFVTMCVGRIDVTRRIFTHVDCGHTSILHLHADGRVDFIKGDNLPLGIIADEHYDQKEHPFEEGDLFVVYSDGVIEAMNSEGDLFGVERLGATVVANRSSSPAELLEAIQHAVVSFSGREDFADDFTCLAFAIRPDARRYECYLTSGLEHLETVRSFVRGTCEQKLTPVVGEDDIHLLALATNEAFTNLVKHANHQEIGHPIVLALELHAEDVIVELRHRGSGFDPNAVQAPSFDGSRDGGFGLHIIKESVDDLTFEAGDAGETVMRMRKRITRLDSFSALPIVPS